MLKSTTPSTATAKTSSTCIKNTNNNNNNNTSIKNVAPVKTIPACTKIATNKNIVLVSTASKSPACTKSTTACTKTTPPPVICTKNTNCTKAKVNGEITSSSNFNIPVVPKCPATKVPPSLSVRNGATNQTANSNSTNMTTTINGMSTPTTNGNSIPAPPPKAENTELRIIIIDENWSQYCYRIKINTPFGKLINRFCQQVRKIDHKSVLFWYHGRLVEDEDTPKTLNIKDGEVILAHYIK